MLALTSFIWHKWQVIGLDTTSINITLDLFFRLDHQTVLAKYEAIWDRYKKQYESKGNAKELKTIKKHAMQNKEECKQLSNQ